MTTTGSCPRCGNTTSHPATSTDTDQPRFITVCDYCGTRRPYPAPAVNAAPAGGCVIDDVGVCTTHGTPIYRPGKRTLIPYGFSRK